ncbi:MAG: hypothetical protein H7Y38_20315 [Armatimonadetes bacterium]|nr:hypothetical protein [Armatimonadota bacterium]
MAFQREISPYLSGDTRPFRCPANGLRLYTPNPAIAGRTPFSIPGFYDTELIRDSAPHGDRLFTVGFGDGHVERGGVDQEHPDSSCFNRVVRINNSVLQYVQDYDETLPSATNAVALRAQLRPYLVGSVRSFTCPDTLSAYPYNFALAGRPLRSFPATTETFKDTARHRSGLFTTGYVNGAVRQVTPTGVVVRPVPLTPGQLSERRIRQMALAMLQYSQDYDEKLPPMQTLAAFRAATEPYVQDTSIYTSPGANPFVLRPELSGVSLQSIPNVTAIEWIRDANNYGDPFIRVGFVDGHVEVVSR